MLHFWKYHGLANDFILIDARPSGEPAGAHLARALCDRRRGVGGDGVLSILPAEGALGAMHVRNADGSVAEMCGNGLRCVAKHLAAEAGLEAGSAFVVGTGAGPRRCEVASAPSTAASEIVVEMGAPELEAQRVPMSRHGRFVRGALEHEGETLLGTAVSMGNPHLVLFDIAPERVERLGPALEHHALFPAAVNVGFARVAGSGIELRVWERGCGFTAACGTGACAAAVAAVVEGRLPAGEECPVRLPGGLLHVRVAPDLSQVWMRGPAVRVFEGSVDLAALGSP